MSGGYKSNDFKEKTGPFKYYLNNRITEIKIYEPSKYPEVLSSFSGLLEKIPQQPDSLALVIYFHKNKKFHSAGYISECCFRYGSWIFLSKNGKEAVLETYKNNILHGPLEIFYSNKLWLKGSYTDGKRDGEWLFYDDQNNLYKTKIYSAGDKLKVIR
jgi:antitoxin component YwqK of YwqJK toxin-antitoxin module